MNSRYPSYAPAQPRTTFGSDMSYPGNQRRGGLSEPMDRGDGSRSSMASSGSFQENNYVFSPISPYTLSSPSDNGSDRYEASAAYGGDTYPPPTSDQPVEEEEEEEEEEDPIELPPFDIEKDGDPRICWRMYYDFRVDRSKAFYELQKGYVVSDTYPALIPCDSSKSKGYSCEVPRCTARPFTRHYDLDRHFKSKHVGVDFLHCDYPKCPHKAPIRKDHCREHFRDYHSEDLLKRGDSEAQTFLAGRADYVTPKWWRCSKCLKRVHVDKHAYKCSRCKTSCEPERVAMRKKIPSTNSSVVTGCGRCQNAWVPDARDPNEELWTSCPTCQPGVGRTARS